MIPPRSTRAKPIKRAKVEGEIEVEVEGEGTHPLQPPPGHSLLNSNLQQAGHLDVFDVEINQVSGYLL
jgi:hypothetical protein